MATGYTNKVQTGEIDFTTFLLTCARAFGACIMQRDDPSSEPPKPVKPSTYHRDSLEHLRTERARWEAMSNNQAYAESCKYKEEQIAQYEKWNSEKVIALSNYQAMMAEVAKWQPPSKEHQGLKDFMLEQLRISIEHDCTPHEVDYSEAPTGARYKATMLAEINRRIAYNTKAWADEQERIESRNKWIADLYASIEQIPA